MRLKIRLDPTLKEPLYRQLVDALAALISRGVLDDGSQLPSVRELALQLRINPNTVARAYRELEHDGWVFSQRGKGVFVRMPSTYDVDAFPPDLEAAIEQILGLIRTTQIDIDGVLNEIRRRAMQDTIRQGTVQTQVEDQT